MRKALVFLGILDDGDLDWMITVGHRQEVSPGEVLIREGVALDSVFLVIDGVLAVRTARTAETDIARLRCGEVVGEMSFVDTRPPSASVVALEPSLVLAILRTVLAKRLTEDVPFAARFYRALAVFLSDRLRATVSQLGYGRGVEAPDVEIDPDTLDAVALAGARFDWLQRRLREI